MSDEHVSYKANFPELTCKQPAQISGHYGPASKTLSGGVFLAGRE